MNVFHGTFENSEKILIHYSTCNLTNLTVPSMPEVLLFELCKEPTLAKHNFSLVAGYFINDSPNLEKLDGIMLCKCPYFEMLPHTSKEY